ncbi:MAG: hypothetical protein ACFE9S_14820 [Candidatus Hermodarchaeota archaeon]
MGWTPPSKFTVVLTFLLMVFGIFILLDQLLGAWTPLLPALNFAGYDGWLIIALILFFLTWFLFFMGVKLSGL